MIAAIVEHWGDMRENLDTHETRGVRQSVNMVTDERVADVRCDDDDLTVDLIDGRTIAVPLAWYPRLFDATPEQRGHWQTSGGGYGIHWPEIDEDLSTEGLLRGAPAPRKTA